MRVVHDEDEAVHDSLGLVHDTLGLVHDTARPIHDHPAHKRPLAIATNAALRL